MQSNLLVLCKIMSLENVLFFVPLQQLQLPVYVAAAALSLRFTCAEIIPRPVERVSMEYNAHRVLEVIVLMLLHCCLSRTRESSFALDSSRGTARGRLSVRGAWSCVPRDRTGLRQRLARRLARSQNWDAAGLLGGGFGAEKKVGLGCNNLLESVLPGHQDESAKSCSRPVYLKFESCRSAGCFTSMLLLSPSFFCFRHPTPPPPLRCGGTVGAILTCPLEVVKTRLQSSSITLYISEVQLSTVNGASVARMAPPGPLHCLK